MMKTAINDNARRPIITDKDLLEECQWAVNEMIDFIGEQKQHYSSDTVTYTCDEYINYLLYLGELIKDHLKGGQNGSRD